MNDERAFDSPTSSSNNTKEKVELLYLDGVLSVSHVVCGVIGIPLNLLIATVIIYYRRLHQPRNLFWLGMTFSNIFVLTGPLIEVYAVNYQNRTACLLCVFMIGVPYASLLLNLLQSLIDRYVAITHPLWHKVNVRTGRIVKLQISSFAVLWTGMKLPYLSNIIPLQCRLHPLDLDLIAGVTTTLFGLCFIGQIVAYIKTRRCLATGAVDPNNRGNEVALSVIGGNVSVASTAGRFNNRDFFVHADHGNISKLELEATFCVLRGVISLCLFVLPVMFFNGLYSICLKQTDVLSRDCDSRKLLLSYSKELLLVHSVYNPCVYIVKSPDFSAILRAKWFK